MPSYYDQNFLLEQAQRRWVLKISHSGADLEVLDLQNRVISRVAAGTDIIEVPNICPTRQGESIATVVGQDGECHCVLLLTYLAGTPWSRTSRSRTPRSQVAERQVELLRSLGRAVGELGRALEGFSHPAMYCDDDWDLKNFPRVRCYLDAVADPSRKALVTGLLDRFEHVVVPRLGELPKAVIHGDINNDNVLVEGGRVVGLIDFGDCVHSARVFEIAITVAYSMLENDDPLATGSQVLSAYEEVLPLTTAEREVVFDLALCRLATSATFGTYFGALDARNTYVSSNVEASWKVLELMGIASS